MICDFCSNESYLCFKIIKSTPTHSAQTNMLDGEKLLCIMCLKAVLQ